jgi:hypothetical protein
MRPLIAALLLLALPIVAGAQERQYAVLSLVGDRLLIVQHEMSTGSRLDRNQRSHVDLRDASLDNATALAIGDALKHSGAATDAVLLSIRDPRLFALQRDMQDGSDATAMLLAGLRERLGEVKATHLVLATKYRHDSMLRLADGSVGAGTLEGLGFYIDHVMRVKNLKTGESAAGFLAPFAYFRLTLVDLASWKIVGEERILGSAVHSAARSKSGHPWDAMSGAAKARALQAIVRREVMGAVAKLVRY